MEGFEEPQSVNVESSYSDELCKARAGQWECSPFIRATEANGSRVPQHLAGSVPRGVNRHTDNRQPAILKRFRGREFLQGGARRGGRRHARSSTAKAGY